QPPGLVESGGRVYLYGRPGPPGQPPGRRGARRTRSSPKGPRLRSRYVMLLKVENLKTYFQTQGETIKAVDDVSFGLERGQTFCVVGESGSGKSMTALSIIQLVPKPAGFHPGGKIMLTVGNNGSAQQVDLLAMSESQKRKIRGSRISMIFQEPMTSLNPVLT